MLVIEIFLTFLRAENLSEKRGIIVGLLLDEMRGCAQYGQSD